MVTVNKKIFYQIGVISLLLLLLFSACAKETTPPGISWQGIVPGKTTLSEAVSLIGEPIKIETRSGYMIYGYEEMDQWSKIELWSKKDVVDVIFFNTFLFNPENPHRTLSFIEDLGRPQMVGWSQTRFLRMLSWPKKGISLYSTLLKNTKRSIELEDQKVSYYVLFPLMTKDELSNTTWPWPYYTGPASENIWTEDRTDAPDEYPEDPYKWFWIPRKR